MDQKWMAMAIELAKESERRGEVPIGAVIVRGEELISIGINFRETKQSPLGHAEISAIHKASIKLNSWRLVGCTLYVTLEPCLMCAGAIVQARLDRVVFGARDPKGGGVRSLYQACEDVRLNHRLQVDEGVYGAVCSDLMSSFFKKRRKKTPPIGGAL
jgi:tRNA(adenine34) deaminase